MTNRDLGRMGESTFALWCSSENLAFNQAKVDKTGWDFFVEWPRTFGTNFPRDMQETPIECRIQVKATDGRSRKWKIKLSNLERLTKALTPVFFCFIEFDGTANAKAAYIVHLDDSLIGKILKKIRQLESENPEKLLNQVEVNISYGDEHRFDDLSGKGVKEIIENYLIDGMSKYIERKKNWLSTLGFEKGRYRLTFTVDEENHNNILNASLGAEASVLVSNVKAFHLRFDVALQDEINSVEKAILKINPRPKLVLATFRKDSVSSPVSFNAEIYIPPKLLFGRSESFLIGVKTQYFHYIMGGVENSSLNISLDHEKNLPFGEITKVLKLVGIVLESEAPLLDITSQDVDFPLPSGLSIPLTRGYSQDEMEESFPAQKQDIIYLRNLLDKLASILIKFDVPFQDVEVSINNIVDAECNILAFYNLVVVHNEITFGAPPSEKIETYTDQRFAQTLLAILSIGNYHLGCCACMVGPAEVHGNQLSNIWIEDLILDSERLMVKQGGFSEVEINTALDSFENSLEFDEQRIQRLGGMAFRMTPAGL
jgi:hypothetical protein